MITSSCLLETDVLLIKQVKVAMYENGKELFNLHFDAWNSDKNTVFSGKHVLPSSKIWWNDFFDEIDSGKDMFFSVAGE